jgi:hypothetical protein
MVGGSSIFVKLLVLIAVLSLFFKYFLDCKLGASLWCSHGRLWERQVSAFSLATHFGWYHATLRLSLANRKDLVKDLIMA